MKYEISSKEEMKKIAEEFVSKIEPKESGAVVVGLYGDLGAGKTTFTQAVSEVLGIQENVVSPTFVIEKIYELRDNKFTHFIHIDAYRLDSSSELLTLGFQNIISDPKNIIFIEWPERVADIIPKHIKIFIRHLENETSREVTIEY